MGSPHRKKGIFLFFCSVRTHRIGANPENLDLVNFWGLDSGKFSELCLLLFFIEKSDKLLPKPRFSKPIFGHPAGSTKLDRPLLQTVPYCKRFPFRSWCAKTGEATVHICFQSGFGAYQIVTQNGRAPFVSLLCTLLSGPISRNIAIL